MIVKGGFFLIYFNVHHVVVKGKKIFMDIYFFFIFLHHINYEEPKRDLKLNDDMF
jgi:hypothetical protein